MICTWQQQYLLIVTACSEFVTQLNYTGTKCSPPHIFFPFWITQWIMKDIFYESWCRPDPAVERNLVRNGNVWYGPDSAEHTSIYFTVKHCFLFFFIFYFTPSFSPFLHCLQLCQSRGIDVCCSGCFGTMQWFFLRSWKNPKEIQNPQEKCSWHDMPRSLEGSRSWSSSRLGFVWFPTWVVLW